MIWRYSSSAAALLFTALHGWRPTAASTSHLVPLTMTPANHRFSSSPDCPLPGLSEKCCIENDNSQARHPLENAVGDQTAVFQRLKACSMVFLEHFHTMDLEFDWCPKFWVAFVPGLSLHQHKSSQRGQSHSDGCLNKEHAHTFRLSSMQLSS